MNLQFNNEQAFKELLERMENVEKSIKDAAPTAKETVIRVPKRIAKEAKELTTTVKENPGKTILAALAWWTA